MIGSAFIVRLLNCKANLVSVGAGVVLSACDANVGASRQDLTFMLITHVDAGGSNEMLLISQKDTGVDRDG